MTLELRPEADGVTLVFIDELQVSMVTDYLSLLTEHLDATTFRLDLTKLESMDTAGIQLLISLANYCGSNSRTFIITGCSEKALNTIQLFNLSGLFGLSDGGAYHEHG